MKKFLLLFLCIFIFQDAMAEGTSVRGGGDDIALEFTNALFTALTEIEKNHPELHSSLKKYKLMNLMNDSHIYVSDTPLLVSAGNGEQESVAANEPATKSIWINRTRWKAISHPKIRQAIALHEVLSLELAEGTGKYPFSAAYLAKYNLRNDEIIFLSGQDPAIPSWKSRSMSCETRYTLKNEQTGKLIKRTTFSLYSEASWQLLDKTYILQHVFATERAGNWPNPMDVPSLIQKEQSIVWKKGKQTLIKVNGKALTSDGKKLKEINSPTIYTLQERLADGKASLSKWENNKKGKVDTLITETTLSDGSIRRLTEDLTPIYIKPVRKIEGETECIIKILPGEEWIALAGNNELGAEIEKVNARALLAYEAEKAHTYCLSKGDSSCSEQQEDLKEQMQKFTSSWNSLYEKQRSNLKKRMER